MHKVQLHNTRTPRTSEAVFFSALSGRSPLPHPGLLLSSLYCTQDTYYCRVLVPFSGRLLSTTCSRAKLNVVLAGAGAWLWTSCWKSADRWRHLLTEDQIFQLVFSPCALSTNACVNCETRCRKKLNHTIEIYHKHKSFNIQPKQDHCNYQQQES